MTSIDVARQEDEIRQKIFREKVRFFIKTYMPEDREKAYDFEADLFTLIHSMNIDIADRYGRHMSAMVAVMQFPPKT